MFLFGGKEVKNELQKKKKSIFNPNEGHGNKVMWTESMAVQ